MLRYNMSATRSNGGRYGAFPPVPYADLAKPTFERSMLLESGGPAHGVKFDPNLTPPNGTTAAAAVAAVTSARSATEEHW